MATPKTNYDNALAYEDGLKAELITLQEERKPILTSYNSLKSLVDSHITGNGCQYQGLNVRIRPGDISNPTHIGAIQQCLQTILDQMLRTTGNSIVPLAERVRLRNAVNTANADVVAFNKAKSDLDAIDAEIDKLTTVDIPAAEYDTQQQYQAWQEWKYDQLTPEEQQELNQVASDAEYLEILNQGRKYAIYVAIAVAAIVVLWLFYKFVIKKGA